MAFCGETSYPRSSLQPDKFPALLVLYVPMAAVGYFELGEKARSVELLCKCGNLFNENPGRQDGGIVCALCDGGVKLMVEVILTNQNNLQKKIPSSPDSAVGPLDIGLPYVPQPPKPVPGEDDRVASK